MTLDRPLGISLPGATATTSTQLTLAQTIAATSTAITVQDVARPMGDGGGVLDLQHLRQELQLGAARAVSAPHSPTKNASQILKIVGDAAGTEQQLHSHPLTKTGRLTLTRTRRANDHVPCFPRPC